MPGIKYSKRADAAEYAKLSLPAMKRAEKAIIRRARLIVPKKTRDLQRTIKGSTELNGTRVTVTVGAGSEKVRYALHVERGTSKAEAQPYLRPALLQTTGADFG